MHQNLVGLRTELPDHLGGVGGEKLHPHLARLIGALQPSLIGTGGFAVDAKGLAHHVIDRHQSEAEAEHADHHQ